jgi:hypothetical protein
MWGDEYRGAHGVLMDGDRMAEQTEPEQHEPGRDPSAGRPGKATGHGSTPPGGAAAGGAPLYKGAPLDPERGPGLGCFWSQVVVLAILVVATPIGVLNAWPGWLTTVMLFLTLVLLLLAGQTVIFLLRLVAADRRTRRRPLHGTTPTIGELDDAATAANPAAGAGSDASAGHGATADEAATRDDAESEPPGVRQ